MAQLVFPAIGVGPDNRGRRCSTQFRGLLRQMNPARHRLNSGDTHSLDEQVSGTLGRVWHRGVGGKADGTENPAHHIVVDSLGDPLHPVSVTSWALKYVKCPDPGPQLGPREMAVAADWTLLRHADAGHQRKSVRT